MLSADVVWCNRCGAYATDVSKGLTKECPGVPSHWSGGGRPQQLAALRAGKHPRTGARLGAPCPEPRWDALAEDAASAVALPRLAIGFLEQRRPVHRRTACVRPAEALAAAVVRPRAAQGQPPSPADAIASDAMHPADARRAAIFARVRAKAARTDSPGSFPVGAGAAAVEQPRLPDAGFACGTGVAPAAAPSGETPAGAQQAPLRRRCRSKGLPDAWR